MHTETKLKLSAIHNSNTEKSDSYIHNEHPEFPVSVIVNNLNGRVTTDNIASKIIKTWNMHDELVEALSLVFKEAQGLSIQTIDKVVETLKSATEK